MDKVHLGSSDHEKNFENVETLNPSNTDITMVCGTEISLVVLKSIRMMELGSNYLIKNNLTMLQGHFGASNSTSYSRFQHIELSNLNNYKKMFSISELSEFKKEKNLIFKAPSNQLNIYHKNCDEMLMSTNPRHVIIKVIANPSYDTLD
ncbi:hypothetical protein GQX74_013101 [Glossina fuscipes]|nr:hypothetical protein GQX74_013101 [Glossina fuscipes]